MKKIKIVLIKYEVKTYNMRILRTLPISDIIILALNTPITRSVDLGHFTTCFTINNIVNTEKIKTLSHRCHQIDVNY